MTHVSNSIPSQNEFEAIRQEMERTKAELAATKESHACERAALKAAIDTKEQEVLEQMSSVSSLQNRFEKLAREHVELKHERETDIQLGLDLKQRLERETEDHERLKDESRSLQKLLDEANALLGGSSVPEVSELGRLRCENERLAREKATAERSAKSAQEDREYAQRIYQEASSRAVEATEKMADLESQLTEYRSLASGVAQKLRETNNNAEIERYVAMLEQANAEVEELKDQLRRRERGRGIMNTRGGSAAPRSPRMGASPPRSRAGSRAPATTGSRPASPSRPTTMRKTRALIAE